MPNLLWLRGGAVADATKGAVVGVAAGREVGVASCGKGEARGESRALHPANPKTSRHIQNQYRTLRRRCMASAFGVVG
jgi:hypothetical protein